MLLLDICNNPNILKVFRIVRVFLEIIRVIVPVLIITSIIISAFKTVGNGKDDSFKDLFKGAIKKIIAGIIVFLLPVFVSTILGLASNEVNNLKSCFDNATEEGIQKAYEKIARELLDKILSTYDISMIEEVKIAIMKIDDDVIREKYLKELDKVKNVIDIKRALDMLVTNYSDEKYESLKQKIKDIENEKIKTEFLERIEKIKEEKAFNSQVGLYDLSYTTSDGYTMRYYLYIPNNAKANMPLIIYLHGDGSVHNYERLKEGEMASYIKKLYGNDFPFIFIQPHTEITSWSEGSRPSAVIGIINQVIKDYKCDSSKVILTGASRGGIGVWYIANQYPSVFSAVVPITGNSNIDPNNFKTLPVWAFTTPSSSDSWNYGYMQSACNSINNVGGNCIFSSMAGYNHGTILDVAYKKETFDWMMNQ